MLNIVDDVALEHCAPQGLLDLPSEIRQQIYDYTIPVCRLAPFPYLDKEWSMTTKEYRGVPGVLLACRKLHDELVPIIYSQAILEVAPAQQGHLWFNIDNTSTKQVNSYSYIQIVNTFRFYCPGHLKLIRRAHIFSNQAVVVDGSCYMLLLQWLVEHTGVEHIQLSSKPMTRIREQANFDLRTWRSAFYDGPLNPTHMRTIRIFTQAERPSWDFEKMRRLRCKVTDGTLNPLQVYFWSSHEENRSTLQLDPRWLTRVNDEQEKIRTMETAAPLINEVMSKVLDGPQLQAYKDNTRYFQGDCWMYQMILVADHDQRDVSS